ncbi:uncharacterized protein F5147DRAFT_778943 [Suillus discolor]|uniref:Uncharacterized protein n=1 Tax=Suillus discolor TaxID=1912936 RepID=A0A9P7EY43_9AGAM|nr:uncharacterized protein F5147DRAFT_778943 [Suillus discolor]KAG2094637.1 hypothetical protein F5147DRAFT_778943 [Suillus discolor]
MDFYTYPVDIQQCNRLIASAIAITAICAQYTTLIMAQPEAHNNTMKSQPAHWINEEITVLINHMYDHCTDSEGSGNFKPQVYTSAVTTINDDPNLQPMQIGPAKTVDIVLPFHAISLSCSPSVPHCSTSSCLLAPYGASAR